jgi:hypothetical protein
MYTQHLIAIAVAALIAVFSVSCSKSPSEQATPASKANVVTVSAHKTDLGVVELSNRTSSHFDLGAGRECIITPTVLPDGNLEIDMVITADQNTTRLVAPRVTTRPGQRLLVSMGDTSVALTPKLKTN